LTLGQQLLEGGKFYYKGIDVDDYTKTKRMQGELDTYKKTFEPMDMKGRVEIPMCPRVIKLRRGDTKGTHPRVILTK
jgi:hypothetical protein